MKEEHISDPCQPGIAGQAGAMAENVAAPAVDDVPKGREAVRVHLIQRLTDAGFVRPRRVSVADFERQQKHLVDQLEAMEPENLITLAGIIIGEARGDTAWPAEVSVMQWARGMGWEPPVMQSRIVTSWLTSVEGPKAVLRGELVELFRHVRRHQLPPRGDYGLRQIAESARDNARRRQIIAERIRDGVASDEDRRWLADWQRDERIALDLVRQGQEKRGAQ